MMEAAVLLDRHFNPIYWHAPDDRTAASLPDSRKLWDEIWKHRAYAGALAHTHPGTGLTGPSGTDITTFAAIEKGLGRPLLWLIATDNRLVRVRLARIDRPPGANGDIKQPWTIWITEEELTLPTNMWLPRLRELSYGGDSNG